MPHHVLPVHREGSIVPLGVRFHAKLYAPLDTTVPQSRQSQCSKPAAALSSTALLAQRHQWYAIMGTTRSGVTVTPLEPLKPFVPLVTTVLLAPCMSVRAAVSALSLVWPCRHAVASALLGTTALPRRRIGLPWLALPDSTASAERQRRALLAALGSTVRPQRCQHRCVQACVTLAGSAPLRV